VTLSPEDRDALSRATSLLEQPGLATRLTGLIGMPIEQGREFSLLDHETVRLQRPQQAVHRSLGQPQALRELADAQASRACGQGFQDADRAVDGLDHNSRPFMVVECCSTL